MSGRFTVTWLKMGDAHLLESQPRDDSDLLDDLNLALLVEAHKLQVERKLLGGLLLRLYAPPSKKAMAKAEIHQVHCGCQISFEAGAGARPRQYFAWGEAKWSIILTAAGAAPAPGPAATAAPRKSASVRPSAD